MDVQTEMSIRKLFNALNLIRLVDATIPMQNFMALLAVAIEEGQNINEIGRKVGISQSSASRNLSSLSDWDWKKKEGLKLVEYRQDPMNLSVKNIYLTRKGQTLVHQIIDTLFDGSKTK